MEAQASADGEVAHHERESTSSPDMFDATLWTASRPPSASDPEEAVDPINTPYGTTAYGWGDSEAEYAYNASSELPGEYHRAHRYPALTRRPVDPPLPVLFLQAPETGTAPAHSETPGVPVGSVGTTTAIVEQSGCTVPRVSAGKSEKPKRKQTGNTAMGRKKAAQAAVKRRVRIPSPAGVAMPDANGAETKARRQCKPSRKILEGGGYKSARRN